MSTAVIRHAVLLVHQQLVFIQFEFPKSFFPNVKPTFLYSAAPPAASTMEKVMMVKMIMGMRIPYSRLVFS